MNRCVPGDVLLLALPSLADELFVGSPTTLIQRGNPYSGDFSTVGACGGQAQSNSQVWYRDPAGPCGQHFNTTNSYVVTFVP